MNQVSFIQNLYDRRAPSYDQWFDGFWVKYQKRVEREVSHLLTQLREPIRLLDMGCGSGSRLARIFETCPDKVFKSVLAGDISWGMIQQAQEHTQNLPVSLFQGKLEELPLQSDSIDVILLLYSVLGCLIDSKSRVRALAECHRVLRKGGMIILDLLSRDHVFYQGRKDAFEKAKQFKLKQGLEWSEGDLLFEEEVGQVVLNHGFNFDEIEKLSKLFFRKSKWQCFDTEEGLDSNENKGHFFGVLEK